MAYFSWLMCSCTVAYLYLWCTLCPDLEHDLIQSLPFHRVEPSALVEIVCRSLVNRDVCCCLCDTVK